MASLIGCTVTKRAAMFTSSVRQLGVHTYPLPGNVSNAMALNGEHVEMVFPRSLARIADAREALRRSLDRAGVDRDTRDDLVLVLSEALANAMRHGSGEVEARWDIGDGAIDLTVVDRGGGFDPGRPAMPPARAVSGRGLAVIDRLTDALEVRPLSPTGTEMWMRRDLSRRRG
jgi:anti-sigma regulatory factor (Ser/Thr protein kinase)